MPSAHTAIIPFDPAKPLDGQEPSRVYLDYETFSRLWGLAKEARKPGFVPGEGDPEPPGPAEAALGGALYKVALGERGASGTARFEIAARGEGFAKVPLPFNGANLHAVRIDGQPAALTSGELMVKAPGIYALEVEFDAAAPERWDQISWEVPPSPAAAMAVEIGADASAYDPVINGGLPMAKADAAGGARTFTAAIGRTNRITIARKTATAAAELAKPALAQIKADLYIAPALERLEVTAAYSFPGAERDTFALLFDASLTPVSFGIAGLASWQLDDADAEGGAMRRLEFKLAKPAKDSLSVRLVAERRIEALPADRAFPQLGAEALRTERTVAIFAADDLDAKPDAPDAYRQAPFSGEDTGFEKVACFLQSGATAPALPYRLAQRDPGREARIDYLYQIGEAKLEIMAAVEMAAKIGELPSAQLDLPPGMAVQAVTGDSVQEWWRNGDTLHLRFASGAAGRADLLVHLTQEFDGGRPAEIALPPLGLPGFKSVRGTAAVAAHKATEVTLTLNQPRAVAHEIDPAEAAPAYEILPPLERKRGFVFEQPGIATTAKLREIPAQFDAIWTLRARVFESWVALAGHVDIAVGQGAVKGIEFSLPANVPEARISGSDVREVSSAVAGGRRTYTVTFQKDVIDLTGFVFESELPHAGEAALPDPQLPGAARAEGYVIVENISQDELRTDAANADKATPEMLPYLPADFRRGDLYRVRKDWSITAKVDRLQTTAGNRAIVLWGELTTSLRANGEEWVKAVYRLQNRSLQFLPVKLDPKAELVAVSVAGESVRADSGPGGAYLVPLIQTKPGELAYDVTLVYRKAGAPLEGRSITPTLDDPELVGMTVERTIWQVYLPEGYALDDFDGNMTQAAATESIAEKAAGELQMIENLNTIAASEKFDDATRQQAFGNAMFACDQLDQSISQIAGRGELSGKLSQLRSQIQSQRDLAVENGRAIQEELGDLQGQSQMLQQQVEVSGELQYAPPQGNVWYENTANPQIFERNSKIRAVEQEQLERVASQLGVNDNVYFNKAAQIEDLKALEKKEAEGKDKAETETRFKRVDQLRRFNEPASGEKAQQLLEGLEADQRKMPAPSKSNGKKQSADKEDGKPEETRGDLERQEQQKLNLNNRGISNYLQIQQQAQQMDLGDQVQMPAGSDAPANQPGDQQAAPQRPGEPPARRPQMQQRFAPGQSANETSQLDGEGRERFRSGGRMSGENLLYSASEADRNGQDRSNMTGDFDSPEIPQQFGTVAGQGGNGFPVTPATPTNFDFSGMDRQQEASLGTAFSNGGIGGGFGGGGYAGGNRFRPAGRVSLDVNFPVEGEAYHFTKLKDHAELEISAVRTKTEKRPLYAILCALTLAAIWGADWLRRRIFARRAPRAAA